MSEETRRSTPRDTADRRRPAWHGFREAYPRFLKFIAVVLLLAVAVDMWLGYKRVAYASEIRNLRAKMTASERQKTDLIVQSEQDKLRMALALARHQAHIDPTLHLDVAVDSATMHLERDGAVLRTMHIALAPDTPPAAPGDSITAGTPRGERTVEQVGTDALVLDGGTKIYAATDTATTSPVVRGNVRISAADMTAILPNVSAGMHVYFY